MPHAELLRGDMSDISQFAGSYVTNFFHFTKLFQVRTHKMM
jgi:hypothetical protein